MIGVQSFLSARLSANGSAPKAICAYSHGNGRSAVEMIVMFNFYRHKNVGRAGARAARPPTSRPWPNGLASLRYASSIGNTGRTSRPRSGIPSPRRHQCAPSLAHPGHLTKKIAPVRLSACAALARRRRRIEAAEELANAVAHRDFGVFAGDLPRFGYRAKDGVSPV